ncbi:hypothetical protein [Pendulispora albinea]|uniref:Secreted protein n=1 Tax=Pendulispora albinea TaxID=2741071 RepID=A0ABZ2M7P7_9BACT
MRIARTSFGLAFLPCLIVLTSQCGNDDGSDPRPGGEEGPPVTAQELCAKIDARAAACGGSKGSLERCAEHIAFYQCGYSNPAVRSYATCRGSTVCAEKATDDACAIAMGITADERAVNDCAAKAKGCEATAKWSAEFCVYPALRTEFKSKVGDCVGRATCAEQKQCLDEFAANFKATCKK